MFRFICCCLFLYYLYLAFAITKAKKCISLRMFFIVSSCVIDNSSADKIKCHLFHESLSFLFFLSFFCFFFCLKHHWHITIFLNLQLMVRSFKITFEIHLYPYPVCDLGHILSCLTSDCPSSDENCSTNWLGGDIIRCWLLPRFSFVLFETCASTADIF